MKRAWMTASRPDGRWLLLCAALAVGTLTLTERTARAQCNQVTSRTTRRPDLSAPSTVTYVHVLRACGSDPTLQRECVASFHPLSTWQLADKCNALANAIATSPDCQAKKFGILVNNCADAPVGDNSFTAQDNKLTTDLDFCGTDSLALGVSGSSSVFSETGDGFRTIPDYEAELITPGCTSLAGAPVQHQLTIAGRAKGQPVSPGQQARIEAFVSIGGAISSTTVPTTSGMSAAAIASQLTLNLRQLGVTVGPVDAIAGVPASVLARMIRVTQPSQGPAVGVSIQVNDLGMAISSDVGTPGALKVMSLEQTLCTISPQACPPMVPATGAWGLVALAVGLSGVGLALARRSSRDRNS